MVVTVVGSGATANPGGPGGDALLTLTTRWENIHPKERVEKDVLEGKVDRTRGVGGFARGESDAGKEYVDVDVPYRVPKLVDHAYLLADGQAIPLDPATESLPGGVPIDEPFEISALGEVREAVLAFRVPEGAENLAFQFFDYQYGNILIPVQGDMEEARGSGGAPSNALATATTDILELAVHRLRFQERYGEQDAGEGRKFAVVTLGGRSLAGNAQQRSIVEIDPTEYLWVVSDGGYLHYGVAGSTDQGGDLRFTPEVYQQQEVAFLVPASAERLTLGARIQREVVVMDLSRRGPEGMPRARESHSDGDVMEVLLFGSRQEGDHWILDLGIRSLVEGQGIDVQAQRQFLLLAGETELQPDREVSASRPFGPPDPFVVPPGTEVRFELVYRTSDPPTALRIRGFRSEGRLDLD